MTIKPVLVQIISWCPISTSDPLKQLWSSLWMPICITHPQELKQSLQIRFESKRQSLGQFLIPGSEAKLCHWSQYIMAQYSMILLSILQ